MQFTIILLLLIFTHAFLITPVRFRDARTDRDFMEILRNMMQSDGANAKPTSGFEPISLDDFKAALHDFHDDQTAPVYASPEDELSSMQSLLDSGHYDFLSDRQK